MYGIPCNDVLAANLCKATLVLSLACPYMGLFAGTTTVVCVGIYVSNRRQQILILCHNTFINVKQRASRRDPLVWSQWYFIVVGTYYSNQIILSLKLEWNRKTLVDVHEIDVVISQIVYSWNHYRYGIHQNVSIFGVSSICSFQMSFYHIIESNTHKN